MKQSKATILIVITLVLVATNAIGSERHFSKRLPASTGGVLRLTSDLGSVTVRGTTSHDIAIEVTLNGTAKLVEDFDIQTGTNGSDTVIVGRYAAKDALLLHPGILDVEYIISMPAQYNLIIKTSGGSLSLSGMQGSTAASTTGGNVSIEDMVGPQEVKTSGGWISAKNIIGDLFGTTTGGKITAEAIIGAVTLATTGGSVNVGVTGEFKGLSARTSGGDIVITIPKSASATVDASTSGGGISCELPIMTTVRSKDKTMQGTINGGGLTLFARTTGGSISIRASE
jgi:hypothetical protein